jgi:hypothetical protein
MSEKGDLHGGIGEIGGFTQICLGKGVEEGWFSNIGNTDNTDLSSASCLLNGSYDSMTSVKPRTYLQVISRPAENNPLDLLSLLLWGHSGKCKRCRMK